MAGLYIHIPFCLKKCHYCNFVISTGTDKDRFLNFLEKEARHFSEFVKGKHFETLYVGGGTPSVLSPDETERVFDCLRRYFSLTEISELTFEANPRDVTPTKADRWKRLGINRISLGVQSFQNKTLETLNRDHDREAIFGAMRILKERGFHNISLDLMLSLPEESLSQAMDSLAEAVRLEPAHISLYELVIEEKTMFAFWQRKGRIKLPQEDLQLEMLTSARKFLEERGFIHYELLSYAKPGFESRHNKIYWANQEYLGLGPGAFSYLDGRRFRNSNSMEEYMRKVGAGDWSASEEEVLSREKKDIESLLLALRLKEGAGISRFEHLIKKIGQSLKRLENNGLLTVTSECICLTDRGQLFAETVFAELSGVEEDMLK